MVFMIIPVTELLGQALSPELDQVAQALARKFNWRIQPSGDAVLNLLGLSTQVPARWIYLSDGPGRVHGGQRNAGFPSWRSRTPASGDAKAACWCKPSKHSGASGWMQQ
jgi:hypothetical protein